MQELSGIYIGRGGELRLQADGRFDFTGWHKPMIGRTVEGTWEAKAGYVYFKTISPLANPHNPLSVLERKPTTADSITIVITDEKGLPIPFATIEFFKEKNVIGYCITDIDGRSVYKKVDFDTMKAYILYGFLAGTYRIKRKSDNFYHMKMEIRTYFDDYFSNARWRIGSKGKLYDPREAKVPSVFTRYYQKTQE